MPSARAFAFCAWDPVIKQLVLYGGQSSSIASDLYSFDPATNVWTAYAPAVTPGALTSGGTAYSPRLGGTLLFAGRSAGSTYTDQTWLLRFNRPPVVDAGPDQSLGEDVVATLSGSAVDPDADPLSYDWVQTLGPAVALSDAGSPTPSFTTPMVTSSTPLRFVLTADDGASQASAAVTVTVLNTIDEPPAADAGADFTVEAGVVAGLSGSGTDPNGDPIVSFNWAQTAGPVVSLSSSSVAAPSFVAPSVAAATVLDFELRVSHGTLDSAPDEVLVTVTPAPDAGTDAGVDLDAGTDAGPGADGGFDAGPDVPKDAGTDAGSVDAASDGGIGAPGKFEVGCGCTESPASALWPLLALSLLAARWPRRRHHARSRLGSR